MDRLSGFLKGIISPRAINTVDYPSARTMGTASAHTACALDQALASYASDDSANVVLGYHDHTVFMITCVVVTYVPMYPRTWIVYST